MKFNYMAELSATIRELIYENNKDTVIQNNQPVDGEHQQPNWKEHLEFCKISSYYCRHVYFHCYGSFVNTLD